MKALAGVLLAVALAVGISSESGAQPCPTAKRDAKHIIKNSVHQRSRLAKSSARKNKPAFCLCTLTKKKRKPHTGMIRTSSYAGYVPNSENMIQIENRESIGFPVNPLPGPTGQWDNTGRDLRRYPPESHVMGADINTNTNPNPNPNSNSNMNWLQNTDQQLQQQQPPQLQE